MTLAEIAALLGLNLGLLLAAMAGLWALSRRWKGIGFIDAVWPLALAAPAASAFLLAGGDPVRKGLLLWLVTLWALPQAWRRLGPAARAEADGRYAVANAEAAARRGWSPGRTRLLLVFLPQAALAWLASLPVQLGQADFMPPVGWIGWTGAVLAVAGIGLEGIGSLGLAKRAAADPSAFRGARRWLRRPEYLGDLAVWWGLFLIAAETGPGQASVLGPIFLTFALAHWARTENPRRVSDGG
jgi:steroid 5-alpha reductase family enzyme